jgi:hypothetical protein
VALPHMLALLCVHLEVVGTDRCPTLYGLCGCSSHALSLTHPLCIAAFSRLPEHSDVPVKCIPLPFSLPYEARYMRSGAGGSINPHDAIRLGCMC